MAKKVLKKVTKIEIPTYKKDECCGISQTKLGLMLFAFGLVWVLMTYGVFGQFEKYMFPLLITLWGLWKVFM